MLVSSNSLEGTLKRSQVFPLHCREDARVTPPQHTSRFNSPPQAAFPAVTAMCLLDLQPKNVHTDSLKLLLPSESPSMGCCGVTRFVPVHWGLIPPFITFLGTPRDWQANTMIKISVTSYSSLHEPVNHFHGGPPGGWGQVKGMGEIADEPLVQEKKKQGRSLLRNAEGDKDAFGPNIPVAGRENEACLWKGGFTCLFSTHFSS